MRVYCELSSIHIRDNQGPWWKGDVITLVVSALEAAGYPTAFQAYSKYGQERHDFGPKTDIKKLLTQCPDITVFSDLTADYPSVLLQRDEDELRLLAKTEGETLGQAAGWFARFVSLLHDSLRERVWLGPTMHVYVDDIPLPSLRPERLHEFLTTSSSWAFISRQALQHVEWPSIANKRDRHLREFEVLATVPLPAGAVRELIDDDLLVIKWVGDDAREAEVRAGIISEAKWLLQHITLKLSGFFTEQGDRLVLGHGVTEHAHVTFYADAGQLAFQAAIPRPHDGQIEPELLAQWKSWMERGQLPDGSPVKHFTVVVPSRDAAIAVHQSLLNAGTQQVLYVGNEGTWWDPFPEGDWIEPDIDN